MARVRYVERLCHFVFYGENRQDLEKIANCPQLILSLTLIILHI